MEVEAKVKPPPISAVHQIFGCFREGFCFRKPPISCMFPTLNNCPKGKSLKWELSISSNIDNLDF